MVIDKANKAWFEQPKPVLTLLGERKSECGFAAYVIIIFTEKEAALRSLTTLPQFGEGSEEGPRSTLLPFNGPTDIFHHLGTCPSTPWAIPPPDQEGNLPSRAAKSRACTLRRRGANVVADFPDEGDLRPNEANTRNIGPPQSMKSAIFVA